MRVQVSSQLQKIKMMSKIDKKKNKILERINELEFELRESLTKKTSATKEINVPGHQRKIQELRLQLNKI